MYQSVRVTKTVNGADIRAFVSLDADPPTYMGCGIPMPPPEYQVLLHYLLSRCSSQSRTPKSEKGGEKKQLQLLQHSNIEENSRLHLHVV
jgi:hypothetical protein